ncbi:unnamed protein product [Schistocephalus solidus]|uniref:Similar to n=1 Tax=Schistocephalus solidus TaxID=70667 RepID=A0A183SS14_SCHSO|nr:unnamed protein product [Schistocephalus solidus]
MLIWHRVPGPLSLRPPCPQAHSAYKVLEALIVHFSHDRGLLRQHLGIFTQTPDGADFQEIFEEHLNLLLLPADLEILPCFVVLGHDHRRYHYLLPAFFRLINWLIEEEWPHAVLIRSFGMDIPPVLGATADYLGNLHPTERICTNIPSNYRPPFRVNQLRRSDTEPRFRYYTREICLTKPKDIYESWSNEEGIVGVQDDFNFWHGHSYLETAAKPLWYDPKDTRVQHIFFDDNITLDEDKTNGIDLMCLDSSDGTEPEVKRNEQAFWEGVYFVQPDLLAAIRDPQYYIDKVKGCVQSLDAIQAMQMKNKDCDP